MKGLLFITHFTERYGYLEGAQQVLEGGCRQVQLRMKGCGTGEVEKMAGRMQELCSSYGARLYINDHPLIACKLGTDGLHLGKSDMEPRKAREIVGQNCIIGGTANTFDDIQRLWKSGVDYIGLGPFRFTTTKSNLSPVLGLEGYRKILRSCRDGGINLPVLAIGGITRQDIPEVMETGVSGIALSSTILNAKDPVEETGRIIEIIEKYQI